MDIEKQKINIGNYTLEGTINSFSICLTLR
jgi:hypothetical protein